jgi:hypothetical protein
VTLTPSAESAPSLFDDDGANSAQSRLASDHSGDRSVQGSLKEAGYEYDLRPTDGVLVPITEVRTLYSSTRATNRIG